MSAVVQARGLGYAVEEQELLTGVDLDLLSGELLAVVGPNGAGKSTLLGLLAGDLRPTTGSVRYAGRDAHTTPAAELARRRAVLLQENRLSFPFSVLDVVRMGRAPWRGRPEETEDDRAVADALDAADVRHLTARRFPTLSGGEKARTSYARSRAQGTAVLLLDEPTAALDIRHQELVLGHARHRARAGDAVLAVVHDLSLAAAYADRVLLLGGGRVHAVGAPDAVLRADALSALYQYPVRVIRHGAELIVLPERSHDRRQRGAEQ
jgi:iron complex transport system ATP-binding protein